MFMLLAGFLFAGMFTQFQIGTRIIATVEPRASAPTGAGILRLIRRHMYFDCTDSSKRAPERSVQ